ncbi:putative bifunctional diguanylate cyclase/phosphodiesterase [Chitinimonas sp. BJB300]|uniref:putative bifunctional diguanylate cyclase/phosphodiesterase n=1 Tax=Chitinimonas sp. BJB300 TaxID=1559339 RepID=UPI0013041028|nr:GGDEF domain-containing phosphodiesterase [Chitinimonas sp. BJB300]
MADLKSPLEDVAALYKHACNALALTPGINLVGVVLVALENQPPTITFMSGPAPGVDQTLLASHLLTIAQNTGQTDDQHVYDDLENTTIPVHQALRAQVGINAIVVLPLSCKGKPLGWLIIGSDVAAFFKAECLALLRTLTDTIAEKWHQQHHMARLYLLNRMVDRVSDGVIVTDKNTVIMAVNPRFCTITGYSEEEVMGRKPSLLASGRHNPEFFEAMWQRLIQLGHWRGEIWNRRKNGEVYPEWLTISAVCDEAGVVENYLAVFSDLSEWMEAEHRIRELASVDLLTGLLNADAFRKRLAVLLKEARSRKERAAIAVLSLSRLRVINQVYGREMGDRLLSEIGQRIQSLGLKGALLSRLGGDEFGAVVPGIQTREDVMYVGRRLSSCFNALFTLNGDTILIRPSIGVACFPEHGEDAVTVLAHATVAMHRCKQEGTEAVRMYTPDLSHEACAPFELEQDLRRAIDNSELWLAYQPQIDMHTGAVIGMETLVRWTHPVLGGISPAKFIPVAEESGLILPIGEWVLAEACRTAALWNQGRESPLRVAVNVSAVQFQRQNWPRLVEKILSHCDLDPAYLELEVTESVVMRNIDAVANRLRALKLLGVQLAIDDFGTGYSSLAYLKRLPIDRLKIDQSFVRGLPGDSGDAAICRAIIGLAGSLGYSIIAEGVETTEQAKCLSGMGCVEAQGWLYARAMPAHEFTEWLDKHSQAR